MGPLFRLSIRQLAGWRRLLIIVLLAALPVMMAAVPFASSRTVDPEDAYAGLISGVLVGAILPIVTLATAAAAFGNELEDRTLAYLTLNPIARWRIVLPKLLAAVSVSGPLLVVSGAVSMLLMLDGDIRVAAAVAVALAVGAVVYTSAFVWAGLLTTRALAFGLIYVFLWEGLFASFVEGVKYLSIRQYTLGLVKAIAADRLGAGDQSAIQSAIEFPAAVGGAALVFVVFFLLSVRRLRTMDVP